MIENVNKIDDLFKVDFNISHLLKHSLQSLLFIEDLSLIENLIKLFTLYFALNDLTSNGIFLNDSDLEFFGTRSSGVHGFSENLGGQDEGLLK